MMYDDIENTVSVRVEDRLVMSYLFLETPHFERAWRSVARLHRQYGNRLFLYQFGVRLVDGPAEFANSRMLALVMRTDDLHALEQEAVSRLVDTLVLNHAAFISRLPRLLTSWFADLSEWRDGWASHPDTPPGLALVDPSPVGPMKG